MKNDAKTTLFGILAAAAMIGQNFAPAEYQTAAATLTALLIGALGYNAKDTEK